MAGAGTGNQKQMEPVEQAVHPPPLRARVGLAGLQLSGAGRCLEAMGPDSLKDLDLLAAYTVGVLV